MAWERALGHGEKTGSILRSRKCGTGEPAAILPCVVKTHWESGGSTYGWPQAHLRSSGHQDLLPAKGRQSQFGRSWSPGWNSSPETRNTGSMPLEAGRTFPPWRMRAASPDHQAVLARGKDQLD